MYFDKTIAPVDIEKLYRHVLRLEGIRHPVSDPDGLNRAAEYISDQLSLLGARVGEQTFSLQGFDFPFRNVEGVINEGKSPELLITSHYDTVRNSPGADDNASAVAAMLETARVLIDRRMDATVRFVSFSLEEENPDVAGQILEYGRNVGILDERFRYTTLHSRRVIQTHLKIRTAARQGGIPMADSWMKADRELSRELTPDEKRYLNHMRELSATGEGTAWIGNSSLIGSKVWAEKAKSEEKQLIGVINLETIGYRSTRSHSQRFPPGLDIRSFIRHKVDLEESVGDFIAVISDARSSFLGQAFFEQCRHPSVDIPALLVAIPHDMGQISRLLPDVLRSDHSSFWKKGYPAIMLTDTADFRTPYYHTPGDTIDKLDFHFIGQVCQATVMTAIVITNSR